MVDGDPFWSTVVDRHPDATYVLLPPEPPGEVPRERADEAITAVRATWRLVREYVAAAGSTDTPALSWRGSPGARRLVARIALVGIGRDAGTDLAARTGVALGLQGWTLRPWRGSDLSTLDGRSPDGEHRVEVEVVAGDGATVLSITTGTGVASWR